MSVVNIAMIWLGEGAPQHSALNEAMEHVGEGVRFTSVQRDSHLGEHMYTHYVAYRPMDFQVLGEDEDTLQQTITDVESVTYEAQESNVRGIITVGSFGIAKVDLDVDTAREIRFTLISRPNIWIHVIFPS